MESYPLQCIKSFLSPSPPSTRTKPISNFLPIIQTKPFQTQNPSFRPPPATRYSAALKNPRGFGAASPKKSKTKKQPKRDDEDDPDAEEEPVDDTIPEVVTNRMMSRMGFSVGIPLFTGLLFFPFFYYLKVVMKIDVPTWIPFGVSFIFFGLALSGVSYGIVSSSWDPMREGSLLGWNEAQKNWPVFWQSLWGRSGKK
ncbi:protein PAM68, chloroplastic-like [Macadamia integrifolia]|uniref:protein PAM68, chloroplastic-like n=1 Tax=Macadamia integrifolia TaxID=60698 RepID=UPI001C4FC965|nr:protein PAM68, chloroplastic-like [Macadamia integrifolia]